MFRGREVKEDGVEGVALKRLDSGWLTLVYEKPFSRSYGAPLAQSHAIAQGS
ncbi:hypothetical protein [Sporisorium scitamineum]|uniref:Uncharacterized protein n=1 Tax=Sporisorium scitamineum TaxID=49012 RepID=A0A0F7S8Q8_9BASI|nr:hypothetical protein [Sporisorium scitamineum]